MEKGLETTEHKESLDRNQYLHFCKYSELAPTAYIATAPNTAPATAPPSFGSSSEPSIIWLFDYEARVSFCFPLISSCIRPGEKFASDVP
jgi:hypothetical protein